MFFLVFTSHIHSTLICVFPCAPIPFRDQCSRQCSGNAHHLQRRVAPSINSRVISRFWVSSCLRHSSHGWYVALVNVCVTRSESTQSPRRKQKKGKQMTPAGWHTTCGARSSEAVGEKASIRAILKCVPYNACQNNLRQLRFQKVPAPSESRKMRRKSKLHTWLTKLPQLKRTFRMMGAWIRMM